MYYVAYIVSVQSTNTKKLQEEQNYVTYGEQVNHWGDDGELLIHTEASSSTRGKTLPLRSGQGDQPIGLYVKGHVTYNFPRGDDVDIYVICVFGSVSLLRKYFKNSFPYYDVI